MYVEFYNFIFKGVPSADREISRRFFIETKKPLLSVMLLQGLMVTE